MAADGNLTFNTKIDESGFNKGTKDLSSKVIDLKNKIQTTEKEIKNLKAELERTGDVKVKTKAAEAIEKDLAKANEKVRNYAAQSDEIINKIKADLGDMYNDGALEYLLNQNTEWGKLQEKISQAWAEVEKYKKELEQVNAAAPLTKDTADYQQKEQKVEELTGKLEMYRAKQREAEAAEKSSNAQNKRSASGIANVKAKLDQTISALKTFANGARRAGNVLKTAFSKTAGKAISGIRDHFKKANSSTNVLEKSLRRIKNTLIRMFFFRLVHSPIDAIKDGLGEIAKISPEVNKNLSALKTESTYLKNSFAALAAPLVNLLTPAFVSFFQTLSNVTTKAGQLIAVLTGQSYTKAVKVQQDYAASLDESTKSADKNTKAIEKNQRALAGFDELNVLDQNDSDTESAGASASPMFENLGDTAAGLSKSLLDALKNQDFAAVGEMFAEKINSALGKINWTKIKKTAKNIATNIAGFINGAVKGTNWGLVGSTIGNGINTAVSFAKTLLNKIDWKKLGKSTAQVINNAFSKIDWSDIGDTIASGINALFMYANPLVRLLNWEGIGTSLRNTIVTTIKGIDWENIGDTLARGINGLIDFGVALVGDPDFGKMGEHIANALEKMLTSINWDKLSNLFFKLVTGVFELTNGFVLEINWSKFGKDLSNSFNNFFKKGGDGWHLLQTMGETVGNFIDGTSEFIISFFENQETANSIGSAFGELVEKINWVKIFLDAITGGVEIGAWILQGAISLVEKFIDGLTNGFTDAEKNEGIKKAVSNLGIAIINLIITGIETGLRILVNAIPKAILAAIKVVLSGLSWVIGLVFGDDWRDQALESINSWSWDIPVNIPRVPRLATGTVVPANYGEFLAVLGDNKREAEVVSPVSAMKQAFMEAMLESGMIGGDGEKEINLFIDGDKFFSWIIGKSNQYKKSHGNAPFQGANI